MSSFNVVVRSLVSSLEDWGKVLNTPASELPKLTSEQRNNARVWGTVEEEERRSVLYQSLQEKRRVELETQGRKVGDAVQSILDVLNSGNSYRVSAVIIEALENLWIVRIQSPQRVLELPIDGELCSQIADDGGATAHELLKREVLQALGRTDLLRAG